MKPDAFAVRLDRTRQAMGAAGIEALLLSLGADLPWLTGYTAMPLERLTMLVLPADRLGATPVGSRGPAGPTAAAGPTGAAGPADPAAAAAGQPVLVVPELEAARVDPIPEVFSIRPWAETEDPLAIVTEILRGCASSRPVLAISDRAWATFLLRFQQLVPGASWRLASEVTAPLRSVKDDAEVAALAAASAAADRVAASLLGGDIKLVGQTERQVSAELTRRLLEEGHDKVNFAIVASGPNSASPHHEPTERTIKSGEPVVCDFGGSLDGYCSDMTRTVFTGPPPPELEHMYEVVAEAQAAGVLAAQLGSPCSAVDAAARHVISDAGFGEYFIHRTGHGIGLEEHEDPYMVAGNSTPIAAGHAFSVEPGIYVPGRWGVRIEDIVTATVDGPVSLNRADHALTVVAG
jgi:Xaa-Pro aminopeptidase